MPDSKYSLDQVDLTAIKYSKALSAESVENAGHGHPGTPISFAPIVYALYHKIMNVNPKNTKFEGRDRFILSAGHASLLQYVQFVLGGFEGESKRVQLGNQDKPDRKIETNWIKYEIDDLKNFRKLGTITPGHPEYNVCPGVEMTTGPLGQGIASGVGFALANKFEKQMLDSEAKDKTSIFDHNVFVVCGDGCLQEGVSAEASSFAGTNELDNLILIYDSNNITIEDELSSSFKEDVLARYKSYGFDTFEVSFNKGGTYTEDLTDFFSAIEEAKKSNKPSIIKVNTLIAWPSKEFTNSSASHGAALGEDAVKNLRTTLGLKGGFFDIDKSIIDETRDRLKTKGELLEKSWNERFEVWKNANPQKFELYTRLNNGELPKDLIDNIPSFDTSKPLASRVASGKVLNYFADNLQEFWGGSADLGPSNNTVLTSFDSFGPKHNSNKEFNLSFEGKTIHFGIREFAMASILNGIYLGSNTKAFAATFFSFSNYLIPAVRLSALMDIPTLHIWTHDSVGVGEDGSTHQPVEQLALYRAMPNFNVVRPADANETSIVYKRIIQNLTQTNGTPTGLILSRQALPVLDKSLVQDATRGGYIIMKETGDLKLVIIATGSEVAPTLQAVVDLKGVRVVSMPSIFWFNRETKEYRESVLPNGVKIMSVEAASTLPWYRFVGKDGYALGIDEFGECASANEMFEKFGFTPENIRKIASSLI